MKHACKVYLLPSSTKFSLVGLDQNQELSVQLMKSECGNRCVYYDQEEKEVLEISRPEVLRVNNEFKHAIGEDTDVEVKNIQRVLCLQPV